MPLSSSATPPRKRVAGSRRRPATATPRRPAALTVVPGVRATDALERSAAAPAHSRPAPSPSPEGAAAAAASQHAPRSLWASALAAGLALALLVGALVYGLRPAMSDTDRLAAVGSARTTLESLLSYTGASFDKHVTEVTPLLAAPFKDEFASVAVKDIKPLAVKNGAVVQARVFESGVIDTTGDGAAGSTVRVMAFLNQATTTKEQKAPVIDQNRVIATMTKVSTQAGDRWLVSKLEAY